MNGHPFYKIQLAMCINWLMFREEFPASSSSIPSGLEKVFCIAQLLVRYLLHSQERLTAALESVQAANRSMAEVLGDKMNLTVRLGK